MTQIHSLARSDSTLPPMASPATGTAPPATRESIRQHLREFLHDLRHAMGDLPAARLAPKLNTPTYDVVANSHFEDVTFRLEASADGYVHALRAGQPGSNQVPTDRLLISVNRWHLMKAFDALAPWLFSPDCPLARWQVADDAVHPLKRANHGAEFVLHVKPEGPDSQYSADQLKRIQDFITKVEESLGKARVAASARPAGNVAASTWKYVSYCQGQAEDGASGTAQPQDPRDEPFFQLISNEPDPVKSVQRQTGGSGARVEKWWNSTMASSSAMHAGRNSPAAKAANSKAVDQTASEMLAVFDSCKEGILQALGKTSGNVPGKSRINKETTELQALVMMALLVAGNDATRDADSLHRSLLRVVASTADDYSMCTFMTGCLATLPAKELFALVEFANRKGELGPSDQEAAGNWPVILAAGHMMEQISNRFGDIHRDWKSLSVFEKVESCQFLGEIAEPVIAKHFIQDSEGGRDRLAKFRELDDAMLSAEFFEQLENVGQRKRVLEAQNAVCALLAPFRRD